MWTLFIFLFGVWVGMTIMALIIGYIKLVTDLDVKDVETEDHVSLWEM